MLFDALHDQSAFVEGVIEASLRLFENDDKIFGICPICDAKPHLCDHKSLPE